MFTIKDKLHYMKESAEIRLTQEIQEEKLGNSSLTGVGYWRGYIDAIKQIEKVVLIMEGISNEKENR